MNRILLCLTLFTVAGLGSAFGQKAAPKVTAVVEAPVDYAQAALDALAAANLPVAEQYLSAIKDPVARLYVLACIERAHGKPEDAIRTLAQLIVRYPNNEKWTASSELQSAELYLELGLLKAAAVTARQVQSLHVGTDAAEQAAALSVEIEKLKKETEGSIE